MTIQQAARKIRCAPEQIEQAMNGELVQYGVSELPFITRKGSRMVGENTLQGWLEENKASLDLALDPGVRASAGKC